jgi:hypothetical protein
MSKRHPSRIGRAWPRPIQDTAPALTTTLALILSLTTLLVSWTGRAEAQNQSPNQVQTEAKSGPLRAGAAAVDVSPLQYPVRVNGMFLERTSSKQSDPVFAKALVLEAGSTRLALVVVDSCMMPRELLDQAKQIAAEKTGIPTDRMLISATHTHSAPAAMGALGCPADAGYVAFLPAKIAEAIGEAVGRLEPARIGWAAIDDPAHTFCRRWIRKPGALLEDPFGVRSVRANMHPGYQSPDAIAPSGPVDPGLTVLSVQSRSGRPLAVLANYSMHYFASEPISADYFGSFAASLAQKIGADEKDRPFVGIMSQGTSGDQMWMDYGSPKDDPGLARYSDEVAQAAFDAYKTISYQDEAVLAMAETKIKLHRRTPDPARLAWAKDKIAQMGDRELPRDLPEVYAKEAIYLHDEPVRELKLQAIRIGGLGIAAIPDEVFAITGLRLKALSPFDSTMNIELANGSEGYIPPPEQHALGGYTTWPARTAGLEVQAEPKIVEALLTLLERVAGRPRRDGRRPLSPYAQVVSASRPTAFWRLDEMTGTTAHDATGQGHDATYEPGVAYYLPGADAPGLIAGTLPARAVHFAGGRLAAPLGPLGEACTIELWFWNGLPAESRPVAGYLLGLGEGDSALRLGIGGSKASDSAGHLFVESGEPGSKPQVGKATITPKSWNHLALVRQGRQIRVYLNGQPVPDLTGEVGDIPGSSGSKSPRAERAGLFIGGQAGHAPSADSFEGKLDEVSVYDRALEAAEIAEHVRAANNASGDRPVH